MTRRIAAVLIAGTLGLASPGGVLFQCRFDGVVRMACCCERERSTHEHPAVAQAMAGTCCDLGVRSRATREAMKGDPAPRLAAAPPAVLPAPPPRPASPVPAPPVRGVRPAPPPLSGPLFTPNGCLLLC